MTEKRQTSQGYIYYPHFTTFRNETSEYYQFCDALSSCGEIFVQAYLDQNFTHKGKGPLERKSQRDGIMNPYTGIMYTATWQTSEIAMEGVGH
jgi:hypothetical protein